MTEWTQRPARDVPIPAPYDEAEAETDHREDAADEEMPRVHITRERVLLFGLFVVSAVAFLYFVLPRIAGLGKTWDRIKEGDPAWLAAAFGLEALSFGGYIILFRTVFTRGETRIEWRESYEITMAGLAATRLFAAAGAGGVVLTAWALRRSGMSRRLVACRMIAFLTLLYGVFMFTFVIDGIGLRAGLFEGSAPFAVTEAASGELAGSVGFGWVGDRDERVGEVGYWMRKDLRGRGLTTRAVGLLSRWALRELDCDRLQLRADEQNVSSQRVAEKAGFTREGVLRSVHFNARLDRRVNFVMFSLLPAELDLPGRVA